MFGNVRVGIAEVWDTIDNRVWSITNPATGTDWTVNGEYITVVPNASETATLTTRNTLTGACGYIGTDTRTKQVILDFRMQFANIANIDNAEFVIGFSDTDSGGRSTENDFIGWGLTADAIVPLTVEGGAATAGSDVSVTETDFNRLTIVLDGTDAHFFVNGSYKDTVDCSALTSVMYIKCYVDTDGVGAATVNIGEILYDPSATAADYNIYGVPPTHWGKKATDFEFPMFFMSKFDMLTPVTGRTAAQVSCAYYKDGDSSETAYVMAGNLTEVDNGHYTVNIGAGEFASSNSFYTVIVRDTLNVFADYVFKVHVTDSTMDELMDLTGTIDTNVDDIETLLGTVDGKVDTIDGIVDAILVDTSTTLPAEHTAIVTDLDDIKGTGFVKDTDSLVDLAHTGADGDTLETLSDQIDLVATQTSVDTIDGIVDAILVDTGTTIPATLTTMDGKLDTIDTNVDDIETLLGTVDGKIDTIDTNVDDIETAIGTPVALDGGAATLGSMLTKIADDNDGADYDAETDSLKALRDAIDDISGGGPSSTYNITNIYNQQKQEFNKLKKENDDLRSIIQKTLNNQSRMSKRIKKV